MPNLSIHPQPNTHQVVYFYSMPGPERSKDINLRLLPTNITKALAKSDKHFPSFKSDQQVIMTTRLDTINFNPTKKTPLKSLKFACALLLFASLLIASQESWGVILGCLKEVVNSRFEYKLGGEAFKIKAVNNLLQVDSLVDSTLFPWKTSSTTKFSRSPMALVKQLNLSWSGDRKTKVPVHMGVFGELHVSRLVEIAKNHCHHNGQLCHVFFW